MKTYESDLKKNEIKKKIKQNESDQTGEYE